MVEVIYFDREMAHHVKRVLPSVWVRQSDYAIGVEPKQKARAIALLRKDAEEHHHSFQFVQGPDNGYGLNSMVVIAYGDEWAARDASAVLIGIPSFIGRLSSSCTIAVMPKQKNEVIELLQKDAAENHYSIQIVQ